MTNRKNKQLKSLTYVDSKGKIVYDGKADGKLDKACKKAQPNGSLDNCSLIDCYNELTELSIYAEKQYHHLKEKLNKLQQERTTLNFQIGSENKQLHLKQGEKMSLDEINTQINTKLDTLKENIRIKKFEHDTLKEETKKIEKNLVQNIARKNKVEQEFNELLNSRNELNAEISHERINIIKKRKNRQEQLKKLLLLIKQDNNKTYNMDYLKQVEQKMKNEINSYKSCKHDANDEIVDVNVDADVLQMNKL